MAEYEAMCNEVVREWLDIRECMCSTVRSAMYSLVVELMFVTFFTDGKKGCDGNQDS